MDVKREVLPNQLHSPLVGGVDERFDLVERLAAEGALEVGKFDYRHRRIGGAERGAIREMDGLEINSLPWVRDIKIFETLRQDALVGTCAEEKLDLQLLTLGVGNSDRPARDARHGSGGKRS